MAFCRLKLASTDRETQQSMGARLEFPLGTSDRMNFDHLRCDLRAIPSAEDLPEIANGSKHKKLRKPNENVVSKTPLSPVVEPLGRFPVGEYMLELSVADEHGELSAVRLFTEAFKFWERFLREFFFIEGRPVLGGRSVAQDARRQSADAQSLQPHKRPSRDSRLVSRAA
jgi:hypothetical protein